MSAAAPRYAVYLTPPAGHALWPLGCAWLGRDPARRPPYPGPARADVSEPWRYGFHATLKAPMRLATGISESVFLAAVRGVARSHAVFEMPALELGMLAGFLALRPRTPPAPGDALRRLADDCVRRLDRWRAAPTAAELEHRLKPGLSPRERAQAAALGYAHVLHDWRCHFTLSNSLPAGQAALRAEAEHHFGPALAVPWPVEALSIFVEPAPGEPFELRARAPLGPA